MITRVLFILLNDLSLYIFSTLLLHFIYCWAARTSFAMTMNISLRSNRPRIYYSHLFLSIQYYYFIRWTLHQIEAVFVLTHIMLNNNKNFDRFVFGRGMCGGGGGGVDAHTNINIKQQQQQLGGSLKNYVSLACARLVSICYLRGVII